LDNNNQILVKDACIIIDLIQLDLLKGFLTLGYKVYTTSSVISEITDSDQEEILNTTITSKQITNMPDGDLFDVLRYQKAYKGISFQDATVLELAKRINGTLLSADGLLRKAGIKEKIIVHGTLWVIHTMFEGQIISKDEAIERIGYLLKINARISSEVCSKVIKKIENS